MLGQRRVVALAREALFVGGRDRDPPPAAVPPRNRDRSGDPEMFNSRSSGRAARRPVGVQLNSLGTLEIVPPVCWSRQRFSFFQSSALVELVRRAERLDDLDRPINAR